MGKNGSGRSFAEYLEGVPLAEDHSPKLILTGEVRRCLTPGKFAFSSPESGSVELDVDAVLDFEPVDDGLTRITLNVASARRAFGGLGAGSFHGRGPVPFVMATPHHASLASVRAQLKKAERARRSSTSRRRSSRTSGATRGRTSSRTCPARRRFRSISSRSDGAWPTSRVDARPRAARRNAPLRPMILVMSSAGDVHAQAVVKKLEELRARCRVLDLSSFPVQLSLFCRYPRDAGKGHRQAELRSPDGSSIDLATLTAVWWRRPQPYRVAPEIADDAMRSFALSETETAMSGIWQATDCLWVNHLVDDAAAGHKPLQLATARDVGLRIPETLITNNPDAARSFFDEHGGMWSTSHSGRPAKRGARRGSCGRRTFERSSRCGLPRFCSRR